MPQLMEGLRLLNRADPFVEVSMLPTGEHVLGAAGEVHLETCVKDLRERFARVELSVSPPLVAFRETVSCPAEAPEGTTVKAVKVVEAGTPSGAVIVRMRALPLPAAVAQILDEQADVVKRLLADAAAAKAAATATTATAEGDAAGTADANGASAAAGDQESSSTQVAALGEDDVLG